MTVLSAQTIRDLSVGARFEIGRSMDPTLKPLFDPFCERTVFRGRSFGLSHCGYDVRIRENIFLPPRGFRLASTIERFALPDFLVGLVKDKSSWAREGLSVFNTVIEPGWEGYLTLELVNHGPRPLQIVAGDPIAQVLLQRLNEPTERPYAGKYQDQPARPVAALAEGNPEADA